MLLAAVASALALNAHAQITAVNSPGALPTTDQIFWSQLGPTFTTVASGSGVTSTGGLNATVNDSAGNMERRDQGNGWAGNFTAGDALLWNQDNGGNIVIDFASPVSGAGAQIQSDFFGPFVATLSAYDSGGALLGTEVFNGNSTSAGDGSAIFAGLDSTSADISSISFSAVNGVNGFAIDTLDLNTGGVTRVPDAGTTSCMFGMALVGLGALRRKLS
jgi:hypothetical protein